MSFYEVFWHGESIGDGGDLEEALLSYQVVNREDFDRFQACNATGPNPHLKRYKSFDDYLDNADPLETIAVSYSMISDALNRHPS